VTDFGTLRKRAYPSTSASQLWLVYTTVSKGSVPAEFFFTLALHLSAPANLLFGYPVLFVRPGLHGLLTHSAYLIDKAHLGSIGFFQGSGGVLYDSKQCCYSVFDLRVGIETPHEDFVARHLLFSHGFAFTWNKFVFGLDYISLNRTRPQQTLI
jgi:hypothetical protein